MANNWSELEAIFLSNLIKSVTEATDKSYKELQSNVNRFYSSPEGLYSRTGAFRDSPYNDGVSTSIQSAVGQISINTSTQYDPAGRDTETIYGYGEKGGLLGNGGFWSDTESKIQDILDQSISNYFK